MSNTWFTNLLDDALGNLDTQDILDTQAKLEAMDFVSVKSFGAVGTGDGTDDTQAFQDAIDHVFNATVTASSFKLGGVVYIPPGSYSIGNIKMRSRVTLMGAGRSSVLGNVSGFTGSKITLFNSATTQTSLRSFAISGAGAAVNGIEYVNSDDDAIINPDDVFDIGDPHHIFSDLLVINCNGATSSTGIIVNSRAIHARDIKIMHCSFGLDIDGSDGKYHMLDISWIGRRGVMIGGGNNHLSHAKCWYIGTDDTYSFGDAFVLSSGRNLLTGCEAQDVSRHGLLIDGGDNNVVEGMVLDNIGNFFLHQNQGIDHPSTTIKAAVALDGTAEYNHVRATLSQRSASPDLETVVYLGPSTNNNYVDVMRNPNHVGSDGTPGGTDLAGSGVASSENMISINGRMQHLVTASIAASADDASEVISTTVVSITGTSVGINGSNLCGLRFEVPHLPQGANIVSGYLHLTAGGSSTNPNTTRIRAFDEDATAAFQANNADISGRSLTTAQVDWVVPAWTNGDRTINQLSPNLKDVVQEVVDRSGFGSVIGFRLERVSGTDGRNIVLQDHATLTEPTLAVRYTL